MKKVLLSLALFLGLVLTAQAATILPVQQGGTGWAQIKNNAVLFGDFGVTKLATSSLFTFASSTGTLSFTYGSTTSLSGTSLCIGTDCRTTWPSSSGGGGSGLNWNTATNFAQLTYATSTPTLWLQSGIFASSTSQFVYASSTAISANNFFGALTGNADTATKLFTPRAINGVNFDGSAAITIFAASSTLLSNNNTFGGNNTFTNTITGSISGNSGTATALAANGTNCSAGNYPLGVDASGNSENCTLANTGTVTSVSGSGGTTGLTLTGGAITTSGTLTLGGTLIGANGGTGSTTSYNGGITFFDNYNILRQASTSPQLQWDSSKNIFTTVNASTTAHSSNTLAVGQTATTSISAAGVITTPVTSALLITSSGGAVSGYGGASACSSNNFVTTLSALGATTCGTASITVTAGTGLTGGGAVALGSSITLTNSIGYPFNVATNATTTLVGLFGGASTTNLTANVANFGGTATTTFTAAGFTGHGTTSPWALLSVNDNLIGSAPAFVIGSSTKTDFVVTSQGWVGFGTSSPEAPVTLAQMGGLLNPDLIIDGVNGLTGAEMELNRGSNTGTEEANIDFNTNGSEFWQLGLQNNSSNDFELWDGNDDPVFTIKGGSNAIGFGTTTPFGDFAINADFGDAPGLIFNVASSTATATTTLFSINSNGAITVSGTLPATSTNIVYDWSKAPPLTEYQMFTAAFTITAINATTSYQYGSTRRIGLCSSQGTRGTATFVGIENISSYTPVTTSWTCDYIGLQVVHATSTSAFKVMYTGSLTGFQ